MGLGAGGVLEGGNQCIGDSVGHFPGNYSIFNEILGDYEKPVSAAFPDRGEGVIVAFAVDDDTEQTFRRYPGENIR